MPAMDHPYAADRAPLDPIGELPPRRRVMPRAAVSVDDETLPWTGTTSAFGAPRLRLHPGIDDAGGAQDDPDLDVARRALDAVNDGIVVTTADGTITYRNAAATRLLDDDGTGSLARTIVAAAIGIQATGCAGVRETEADGRWFEVRPIAFVASDGLPRALVVLTCTSSTVPSVGHIAHRHGLTVREAAVARLLAEGHRNDAIAKRLSIRDTTARHYTERVLMKLGTRSRGEAAAIILGTKAAHADPGALPAAPA